MASAWIHQNLKIVYILFTVIKLEFARCEVENFHVNISPCVFNRYITKCKLEWRYSLDI